MKKLFLAVLLFLCGITGFASKGDFVKHDIAISSDSERVSYRVFGTGETSLIFIHGWSCDSRYWQKQVSIFSKDHQVITIDLAGHGNSSSNRKNYTILSFAQDVEAIIDKEKVSKAILIGHSMGGAVIAKAAQISPKKVIGIIGVDTLHDIANKVSQKTIDEMVKPFQDDFKDAAQNFVLTMFPSKSDKKLVDWVKEDMSSAPKEVAMNAFTHYLGQYVSGEAAQVFENINIPVVSINARLWPTNLDSNKKHIKKYKLLYIEESGHFPMLEKPIEFNELLTNALDYIRSESNNK